MSRRSVLTAAAAAALAACSAPLPLPSQQQQPPAPAIEMPPPPPREFRAAWVATVANIDWPSKPGLSAATQRSEALAILDRARAIGLNALVLQVRPAADAVYPSALEPWSEYLSGQQGRPPYGAGEAPYDPLAFWIAEAHRRGLELHAWLNPYRARSAGARSPLVAPHLAVRQPALVKSYGDMLWIDPGEPAAAAHLLAVVSDIVGRYDVDGIHIDDYFYPYPLALPAGAVGEQPFPDDESWARYRLEGGALPREGWRRANVDGLVQALHQTVQAIKPWVSFGVSPFGIGKPEKRPPGVSGFSQYDKLYADVEKWLANGWLDYLVPQLYWPIDRSGQQYPVLLDYWLAENTARRHLYAGLYTSLVAARADNPARPPWPAREIVDQVALQRSRAAAGGHVHFSMVALMQDRDGIATLLQNGFYATPALVPATPWRPLAPPPPPRLRTAGAAVQIEPGSAAAGGVATWAVWRRLAQAWQFAVLPGHERSVAPAGADAVVVAAVGRTGLLSEPSLLRLP